MMSDKKHLRTFIRLRKAFVMLKLYITFFPPHMQ